MAKQDMIDARDGGTAFDRYDAERVALDRVLTDRVVRAHAAMTAALAEVLDVIRDVEDAESYWAQGFPVSTRVVGSELTRTW